jgi:hypothetical protein
MRSRLVPVLLACVACSVLGPAASGDVVTTKDGLVLEGAVTKGEGGAVTVATDHGTVRLTAAEVASIAAGEGPRTRAKREAAAIPVRDVDARYRLAARLQQEGLADLAREQFETIVAESPDHPAARRALGHEKVGGSWLSVAEARRRSGLVLFDGKWLLAAEAEAAGRAQKPASTRDATLVATMRTAATGEAALARAAAARLLAVEDGARREAATSLLLDRDPAVRKWAATHLGALGDERALKGLVTSAVRDPVEDVRVAAVHAAAAIGNEDVAVPIAKALDSEHPGIVANAAGALATLGDPRGVTYLVRKIVGHGGSPRVNVEFLTQVSYIRDYDVEVAQSSNIADPIIGIVQEGMVLDVKVLDCAIEKTVVETVLVGAFNRLAGANAKNAADVAAWWRENGAKVPRFDPQAADRRGAAERRRKAAEGR